MAEVDLEPSSGVPPEYCEFLPKAEFRRALPWLVQNRDAGAHPPPPPPRFPSSPSPPPPAPCLPPPGRGAPWVPPLGLDPASSRGEAGGANLPQCPRPAPVSWRDASRSTSLPAPPPRGPWAPQGGPAARVLGAEQCEGPSAEWLEANCDKYKALVVEALGEGLEGLQLDQGGEKKKEERKKSGKPKKEKKREVVLERQTRNRRKCITTVRGLEMWDVDLKEAAKLLGKKFACGASASKNAAGFEEIDVQGDFQEEIALFLLDKYGAKHSLGEKDFVNVEKGKRTPTLP